ncbi:MAG: SMC family ATPase [Clostridiaceae bacterium]|nr:SMC family ATPase [Clostridiaceae bacterium]
MKLQKLVITGFGPYAMRQELDFEKNLQGKSMFVITGNTGAGKTTIFDAINFALYGEASGSDRETKSLRSDFADPQTPTEVELWFSLRGKEYYVKRTPAYIKPKQRGEGFIESKPSAEIKLSKDKTVAGVTQVTREIENILGITTEQFKQLVMIPQGEFKRLLNAKSEEKEDIFRKIFGTEVFQSIQNQMKEKANKLERGIKEVQRDRLNKIKSFICKEKDENLFRLINAEGPNIELLMRKFQEFIADDKEEKKNMDQRVKETEQAIIRISKEITIGDNNNKKFSNLEKNKEELDKLESQSLENDKEKIQLDKGKKALNVKVYEDKYNDKEKEFEKLNLEIKIIEKKIEGYNEGFIKADLQFKAQQHREVEKNKLVNDIAENQRLIGMASNYEANKDKVETLVKKVREIKDRIEQIGLINQRNQENIVVVNKDLDAINKAKEEKGKLEIKQVSCENWKEKLKQLKLALGKWIEQDTRYKATKVTFDKIEQKFQAAKGNYESMEDIFRKSQAGILATDLKEGTACPVCGSVHHPNLAKHENSEITEETIKESKEVLEKIRLERDEKLKLLTSINASLKSIKENNVDSLVKELLNKDTTEDLTDISVQVSDRLRNGETLISDIKNRIQSLCEIINKESEKIKDREKLQSNNESLRKELELKNVNLVEEERTLSANRNTLENIKTEFKGEIKTVVELNRIIKILNDGLLSLKTSYEKAEKEFNSLKSLLDQEEGKYKSTKQMKKTSTEALNIAKILFYEKITELGFNDVPHYKANCLAEEQIKVMEVEIKEFELKLARVKQSFNDSAKEIEGLLRVDLTVLQENLTKETSAKDVLAHEVNEIFSRIKNNILTVEGCEKYSKDIEVEENNYKTIGKLSNILNGDNLKKISFERYVLASYFEDIIQASNIRFNKMTSGRFELLRKQDIGDKRKGQGLDLEVFDNYTGKSRDIKTLSGGEGFKASLSMALGLADIVQAHAGGIQLDTMFIDEGFGTLDPESLDNAVECLMDLQNDGRLVGIISHVPELKERIDARLEVSSTNKGSMATFKV